MRSRGWESSEVDSFLCPVLGVGVRGIGRGEPVCKARIMRWVYRRIG
jgi:hypothetical protein